MAQLLLYKCLTYKKWIRNDSIFRHSEIILLLIYPVFDVLETEDDPEVENVDLKVFVVVVALLEVPLVNDNFALSLEVGTKSKSGIQQKHPTLVRRLETDRL